LIIEELAQMPELYWLMDKSILMGSILSKNGERELIQSLRTREKSKTEERLSSVAKNIAKFRLFTSTLLSLISM
jgi:hypothetical protein